MSSFLLCRACGAPYDTSDQWPDPEFTCEGDAPGWHHVHPDGAYPAEEFLSIESLVDAVRNAERCRAVAAVMSTPDRAVGDPRSLRDRIVDAVRDEPGHPATAAPPTTLCGVGS